MRVFVVQHVRYSSEDEDVKFVGVFSSKEAAHTAIQQLVSLPGFREFPDGFYVDEYILDDPQWKEGF